MVRRLISLVIVGSFMLVAVAWVMGGAQVFERVLPSAAVSYFEGTGETAGVVGAGGPAGSGDSPADFLEDSSDGLMVRGPIAAHVGNRPVFIADAITGYGPRVSTAVPSEITTIRPILGCLLTPPLTGSTVGHATAGQSGMPLALSTYNDNQLADAVQIFVNAYRTTGMPVPPSVDGITYEAYDVAVTETRAPVYLVLENRIGNRIWNIHLAEGARIERVVLLGGEQAGVANLDPVIPVEVILNDGLAACGIEPAYELNSGHLFYQSLASGAISQAEAETRLAGLRATADAYDIWFRDSFGVKARESRVGFDAGTLSIIGPIPREAEPKAIYAPISGSKIRTTQDEFFEIAGQVAQGDDFAARVTAIATTFAFGDLATLRQGVDF